MPTEADALTPAFKVAVELTVSEALAVASELLAWAAQHTTKGKFDIGPVVAVGKSTEPAARGVNAGPTAI